MTPHLRPDIRLQPLPLPLPVSPSPLDTQEKSIYDLLGGVKHGGPVAPHLSAVLELRRCAPNALP